MRVLVIPDIHLKTWIFDRAEQIIKDGKADRAVCLMDIPDDWNMEFQIERYGLHRGRFFCLGQRPLSS